MKPVTSPIGQDRLVSKVNALTQNPASAHINNPQNLVFNEKGTTLSYKYVVDELIKLFASNIESIGDFYSKIYGEGRWKANTVISIAIGQGEILATPLQIANLAATIANRGYFYTPHVVKEIQGEKLPAE